VLYQLSYAPFQLPMILVRNRCLSPDSLRT
jgi:hypothetical protein